MKSVALSILAPIVMSAALSKPTSAEPYTIISPQSSNTIIYNREKVQEFINAAYYGDIIKMMELLEQKVDINSTDEKRITALMFAAKDGRIEILEILLSNGADVNLTNSNGGTALMIAAQNDHTEIVEVLLAPSIRLRRIAKGFSIPPQTPSAPAVPRIAPRSGR